ncbi:TetR family transcriptional regulator [Ancylobacter aquaticus]|uniref:TetR family transcriptional regulator n=1 Tax=Ancylobacter aquaticus TaxID=100 RepID=A0A4R1I8N4_ANCAQ|nr:TetR/AcrR family transcriptional regulator [Ancylobacter aquaticus]TCK30185.1 TetR family transcriptional regulator [Ancylobacter aquaticus]
MASLPDFAHQRIERRPAGEQHAESEPGESAPSASGSPPTKQGQILRGAREVFLASGFDGASMGEIARAAGVSKGTLYVYFDSKENLFTALVTDECKRTAEACFDLDPDGPTVETLRGLACRYIHAMLEPGHIRTVRMVIGVGEKLPDIGRAYMQAGQEAGVARLSGWLRAKIAQGEFVIEDVEMAAWQFMLGCQGKLIMPMLFGDNTRPDAATIRNVVDQTVGSFLGAFGTSRAAIGAHYGTELAGAPFPPPASAG